MTKSVSKDRVAINIPAKRAEGLKIYVYYVYYIYIYGRDEINFNSKEKTHGQGRD